MKEDAVRQAIQNLGGQDNNNEGNKGLSINLLFAGMANKLNTSITDKKRQEKPLDAIKSLCKEVGMIKSTQKRIKNKIKILNKRVQKFYELTAEKKFFFDKFIINLNGISEF